MNVAVDQGATLQARYQEFLGAHKNLRSVTNAYNAYLEKIAGMAVLRGSVPDEYLNHVQRHNYFWEQSEGSTPEQSAERLKLRVDALKKELSQIAGE